MFECGHRVRLLGCKHMTKLQCGQGLNTRQYVICFGYNMGVISLCEHHCDAISEAESLKQLHHATMECSLRLAMITNLLVMPCILVSRIPLRQSLPWEARAELPQRKISSKLGHVYARGLAAISGRRVRQTDCCGCSRRRKYVTDVIMCVKMNLMV